jgi:hypothetical protein
MLQLSAGDVTPPEAASRHHAQVNDWRTAMYEALARADWYCDGGFCRPLEPGDRHLQPRVVAPRDGLLMKQFFKPP